MQKPIVRINGKRIHRNKVVKWWLSDSTYINVMDATGETESKDMGTTAKADSAMEMLDNLTEIDDIDGL